MTKLKSSLSGKTYDIYIAAPLFNKMELARNENICKILEAYAYRCYLPQRDGGEASKGAERWKLFENDVEALSNSACVIALIDGAHIDEGTCWEIGYAYACNTPIIMLKTDSRCFMGGNQNVMIDYCGSIYDNIDAAVKHIGGIIQR